MLATIGRKEGHETAEALAIILRLDGGVKNRAGLSNKKRLVQGALDKCWSKDLTRLKQANGTGRLRASDGEHKRNAAGSASMLTRALIIWRETVYGKMVASPVIPLQKGCLDERALWSRL